MTRTTKNHFIWVMFGVYLGTFLARVVAHLPQINIFEFVLVVFGLLVAVLHYLPDKPAAKV